MEIQKHGIGASKPNNCVTTIHHWQAIGQQFHACLTYLASEYVMHQDISKAVQEQITTNTNHLLGLVALLVYGQAQQEE